MVDGLMSEVLRRKAQEAGINGKQLAKMIGKTAETVSRHMNGRTHMSHYDAALYADWVEWLMGFPRGYTSLTSQELQQIKQGGCKD